MGRYRLLRVSAVMTCLLALCACAGGGGTSAPPPVPTYTIGGTISGLTGTGLVLRNNGSNTLAVSANGPFTFSTELVSGAAYGVTVGNAPASPAQTCLVTNGSGTVAAANITNITVTCTTNPGESCSSAGECGTGFCADGVCCNSACTGACEACSNSLTGGADGTCAAAMPAGTASYLDFILQPADVTAGASFPVAVAARDADSCIVTAYTQPVTVAIQNNPAAAALSGTTMVTASSGTATFSGLSVDKSGNGYTLQATSAGLISATSGSFNVIPGDAAKLDFVVQPQSATAGSVLPAMSVQISDAYGNLVSSVANISLSVSGGATLSGTLIRSTASGVATFNDLSITQAGTYTLTASGAGLTQGTSVSFTISPAATGQISLAPASGTYVSGVAVTAIATALDVYGNVTPSYRGTVHFTSSDSFAALPADYTFTGTDNGSHTFGVTFKSAGTRSLTVTDTVNGTLTVSHSYTVAPAALAFLTVMVPVNASSGAAFTITVSARDVYNNLVPTYNGTVTFTSTDADAVLPANYTFSAGDNGYHSFVNGVTLATLGNQRVTATDTATPSIAGYNTVTVQ